jgi:hypothetical protein
VKIIEKRKRVTDVSYRLVFNWKHNPGAGFSFLCDENGGVGTSLLPWGALGNYSACVTGEYNVTGPEVVRYENTYTVPAVGRCVCGREVELIGNTNPCDCGRAYNWSGQELAPRDQWGWETGEHPADVAR